MRPVIGQYGVVDGALRQFGVQLAGVAVGILAVEIVDAVGDVRGLLYLGDKRPGSDAVNASGRQEKEVAGVYFIFGEQVGDGVVRDAGFVLGRRHLLGESRAQACAFVGVHDVPHLGLAFRFVALPCQCVVRVHLDREILTCVDEFDQQRELLSEAFCIGLAEQCRAVACDQPGQGGARLGASRYDRFVTLDARKFPAFADLLLVGGDVLVGDDLFAAPDCRFENGLELIHNFLFPDAVKNYCCFCASSWLRANA